MITVTVTKKNNSYTEFTSKGHAGYAEEGQDIICAAVSVLVINTVNSLETLTHDQISVKEKDGYVLLFLQSLYQREGHSLWIPLFSG